MSSYVSATINSYTARGGEEMRLQRKQDGVEIPSYTYDFKQYWAGAPHNFLGVAVKKPGQLLELTANSDIRPFFHNSRD